MKARRFIVPEELGGQRLDVALARLAPELSRRQARRLVDGGSVFVDGKRVQVCSRAVRAGSALEVVLAPPRPPQPLGLLALDDDVVAIDKPARMPAEPTREGADGTAAAALGEILRDRGLSSEGLRAAHRLDVDTTGVLVFARSADAASALSEQFRARRVARRYLALVAGDPPWLRARIDIPLSRSRDEGGRVRPDPAGAASLTLAVVLARGARGALLACTPVTGRLHQLRAHLAEAGHPLAGDRRYGGESEGHLGLHALSVRLVHPAAWNRGERDRRVCWAAPLPEPFLALAAALGVVPAAAIAAANRLAPELVAPAAPA